MCIIFFVSTDKLSKSLTVGSVLEQRNNNSNKKTVNALINLQVDMVKEVLGFSLPVSWPVYTDISSAVESNEECRLSTVAFG